MSRKKLPPHPMQPVVVIDRVVRFRANAIVRFLVDTKRADLNEIAAIGFPAEDCAQFWQLMGYSVSAWGSLSFVPRSDALRADEAAEEVFEGKERERERRDKARGTRGAKR